MFPIINYLIVQNQNKKSEKAVYNFYHSSLHWMVVDKYIDTNEHMGRNLTVTPLDKDSPFLFMTSNNRLSYTLYNQIGIGDTLRKNSNSLTVTISNGYKHIIVESDTSFITIEFLKKYGNGSSESPKR
ncbi:MAG: hypothetical protein IT244_06740 [Bacteroidia bacterium]|nr:hypothetical protein [Bacteroidia bacterium]